MTSSALSFLKYSTSDKSLSTEEIKKWQDVYDVRRGEILAKMSIGEIQKEFTTFFTTYSFPSDQHKQIVKRSLQRIIPKIFPGFGCDIQRNYVVIRKIDTNESLDIRGKIVTVSNNENNASIFASGPNNVKTNYCKNCSKLERKISELEQIIKTLSLKK